MQFFNHIINKIPKWIYLPILLLVITYDYYHSSDDHYHWSENNSKEIISSDGSGYYAHLPQFFIYGTSNFEFLTPISKEKNDIKIMEGLGHINWGELPMRNKFFVGTAVCMSPFFLIADHYAKTSTYERNGYSHPYEVSIAIAAFCFLLGGVTALYFFLRSYHLSIFAALSSISLLAFSTNLKYYTLFEPALSHVYSFGVIVFFLWSFRKYSVNQKPFFLFLLSILLGLITILRPVNLLVLIIIPFLYPNFAAFKRDFFALFHKNNLLKTSFSVCLFLIPISIQILNVRQQYGVWRFSGYTEAGFDNFLSPEIINVLFSFQKGLFVYTPAMILCVIGLFKLYKKQQYLFLGWSLFFFVFTYITSSWWNWYYGGSLGMRPYVDVYAIMVIPFAFLVHFSLPIIQVLLVAAIIILFKHNSIQNHQKLYAIYHLSEMNYKRYWDVFLKTDTRFHWLSFRENFEIDEKKLHLLTTNHYDPGASQWKENVNNSRVSNHPISLFVVTGDLLSNTNYYQLSGEGFIQDKETISSLKVVKYYQGEAYLLTENFYLGQVLSNNKWEDFKVQGELPKDLPADSVSFEVVTNPQHNMRLRKLTISLYK